MPSTAKLSARVETFPATRDGAAAIERLLAGATQVFGNFGFSKATVQDIAAAAGVSKPIFYRHFANKQAIFERVVETILVDWQRTLVEAIAEISGGAEAELRAFFLESLEYGRRHTLITRLLTRDTQFLITAQSDVNDRAVAELARALAEILQRGQSAGEVRDDIAVEHLADLLTEIHYAYANRQLITGIPVDGELAKDLVKLIWSAVRA